MNGEVKITKAVILAAGRGTRMKGLTEDIPKPMIEVQGSPVLESIVRGLVENGVLKPDEELMVAEAIVGRKPPFSNLNDYNQAITDY